MVGPFTLNSALKFSSKISDHNKNQQLEPSLASLPTLQQNNDKRLKLDKDAISLLSPESKLTKMNYLKYNGPVEFWDARYQKGKDNWDLNRVAQPFVNLLEQQKVDLPPGKLIALGCGNGHDPAYFGKNSFDVLGVDYAPQAVINAQKKYDRWAKFRTVDILNLPKDLHSKFDYVLEHACFCVMPPNKQAEYVQSVLKLLKPKGTFIGLFITEFPKAGPPYTSTAEEIKALFEPHFNIEVMHEAKDSIEPFGKEMLCVFRRKIVV